MKIDGQEILNDLKASVKVDLDLVGFATKQVEKIVEPLVDSLLAKVTKLIPGGWDDAVVATFKPQLYKELKEEMVKELAKVEKKVDDVLGQSDEAPKA